MSPKVIKVSFLATVTIRCQAEVMQYSCKCCRDESLSSHYYNIAFSMKWSVISKDDSHFEFDTRRILVNVYLFNHF